MQTISPVTLLLFLLFVYPLIRGFLYKFSSNGLKGDIEDTNRNISFVAAMLIGVYLVKKIFIIHGKGIYQSIYQMLPVGILKAVEGNRLIIYAIIMPVTIFLIYKAAVLILDLVSGITLYPIIDKIEKFLFTRKNIFKRFAGAAFQVPKGICYVIFAAFVLNILSLAAPSSKLDGYLKSSRPYRYICREVIIPVTNSAFAKQLPNIINDSFKIVIRDTDTNSGETSKDRTIIYYNGVTLNEGVRSDKEIDEFALKLTDKETSSYGKAKIIYNWIGSNISYDYDKAEKVLHNDFSISSGAIPAFNTDKGICFDYSCLYVAMCRANGLKVRIITGEGFNGVGWVSHAWNQVYITEENRWINVDTTFYKAGNYFDSRRFQIDHRADQTAGEW